MYKVYGDLRSGNCYKVKLMLHHLGIAHEWIPVDVTAGETRTPSFLAMNPNGRIPVLEIEPGAWLPESNAILCYLAQDTPWLPSERLAQARVMQWLFFEQYSHEPYIATSRYWLHILREPERYRDRLAEKRAPGHAALEVMEKHLAGEDWFAAGRCTIADLALYAYTHVAGEGGFDLAPYAAVRAWLARVVGQPGHVAMYE